MRNKAFIPDIAYVSDVVK